MDCEKFESTMIDELYGELDELTSAAAKRHVSGCARCSSMLSGLKATRQLAVLPVVEPPAGLEERILAAAREAQKVVPIRSRMSRAVSWAGSWAMRPQTAMAALFLLMIGSSALLLRSRAHKSEGVAMRVTEQGAPAPQEVQAEAPLDSKEASRAHGALGRRSDQQPAAPAASAAIAQSDPATVAIATATATAMPMAAATAAPITAPQGGAGGFGVGGSTGAKKPSADRDEGDALKGLALNSEAEAPGASRGASNAGPVAGAPRRAPSPATPPPPPAARPKSASASADDSSFADLAKDKEAKKEDRSGGADGDAAGSAYRARNYAEAARLYDEMAKRGDKHAALQAARSVRENSGCSAAVSRLDALSASAWGTDVGYDATLEAGYCYNALGNLDLARARFSRLLTVSSHAARAQNALNSLSAVATRKSAAPAKAAPQATQAPANARPAQPQSQSKPADTAAGF